MKPPVPFSFRYVDAALVLKGEGSLTLWLSNALAAGRSYAQISDDLRLRGIEVSDETVRRWVVQIEGED